MGCFICIVKILILIRRIEYYFISREGGKTSSRLPGRIQSLFLSFAQPFFDLKALSKNY